MPDISDSDRQSVLDTAQRLQIDPRTLAAVIDYESGFKPNDSGPSGKGYPVRGLIGFDPENVRKYGEPAGTIAAQMPQVEQYLLDRGWKPGQFAPNDLGRLYSIVNAGSLDANGNPRWGARDTNGTIAQHVGNISRSHYGAADRFLMPQEDLLSEWLSPKGVAPAPSKAAPAASEDLLSEWLSSPNAAPADAAAKAKVTIAGWEGKGTAPSGGREGLPELMNRLIREHQNEDLTDTAIRKAAEVGRGVGDVGDTIAQGITWMGEKGAHELAAAGVISPERAQAVSDWRQNVNQGISRANRGFEEAAGSDMTLGRTAGQVLGAAPFLAIGGGALSAAPGVAPVMGALSRVPYVGRVISPLIRGAITGGSANVLTSSTSDAPLEEQARAGAELGAPLGLLGHGVGQALSLGSRETARLAQAARDRFGISLRPAQMSDNASVRFMDSVLQRLPFTGIGPHAAEQQTAFNRALASEMGVTSDKISPDVIQTAKRTAYNAYDAAKATMGPLKTDTELFRDLKDVYDNAHYNLEPKLAKLIDGHIENVINKIDMGTRTLDPDLFQSLTRHKGPLDRAINSPDSKIAGHAEDIKGALDRLVGRNDPALKALYDRAQYRYAIAKAIEPLANASTTGNISPRTLLSKVAEHPHSAPAELGRIGRQFLTEPPSSGTAERELQHRLLWQLGTGALGLGAAGAAHHFDPEGFQRDVGYGGGALAAGVLGGRALASRPLANWMIYSGLRQPGGALSSIPLAALAPRTTPWSEPATRP